MLNKISIHIGLLMATLTLLGTAVWQYTRAIGLYNRPAEIVYRCDGETRELSQKLFLEGLESLRESKVVKEGPMRVKSGKQQKMPKNKATSTIKKKK